MRFLLDTHVYILHTEDNPALTLAAAEIIDSEEHTIALSIASLWEIAIKISVGKLELDHSIYDLATRIPAQYGFSPLLISPLHLDAVSRSRLPRHHRDPFDRLLVAQAKVENLPIVSGDAALDAYGIARVW